MNVFVCSTPIQIVRAVYMRYGMAEFKDPADLYIRPTFKNARQIAEKIRETGLFSAVYLVDLSGMDRAVSARLLYGRDRWARLIRSADHEKVIGFNIESELLNAFYNRNKHKKGFQYHYVEDAPGMYKMYAPKRYAPFSVNGILRIEQPYYHTYQWWFSDPDFMDVPEIGSADVRRLPPIDATDDKFVSMINEVFGFSSDETLDEADILITEESFYTDGKMIDDFDHTLYQEIRDHFPDKNVVVKLHPRTRINRFEKGFKIMQGSWIPWELYVMNGLRQKQHFPIQIGIVCSALTSDKFMFDAESPKVVLAPLFKEKIKKMEDGSSNVDEEVVKRFEALRKTYVRPEQMMIAYDKEGLFDTLEKWVDP